VKSNSAGVAIYLRHIAAQCVEIAGESSDEITAQKLRNLSIELAYKAEQVEALFRSTDEGQ
jgi:hypothetical protein